LSVYDAKKEAVLVFMKRNDWFIDFKTQV